MPNNVIFMSEYSGYKIRYAHPESKATKIDGERIESGKEVVVFDPFRTYSEERGTIMLKGYKIIDADKQPQLLKFMREYPDYGKGFKEVKSLPLQFSGSNILTGVGVVGAKETESKELQAVTKQKYMQEGAKKTLRYVELKQTLFKSDGTLKANVKEEEKVEFEQLEQELQLT